MMNLEPLRQKLLSNVSSSVMSQYLWVTLGACLHGAGNPLCASLQTVDSIAQLPVSLCTQANLCHSKQCDPHPDQGELHLPNAGGFGRASGSCTSLVGL